MTNKCCVHHVLLRRGRPFSGKTITYFCGKRIKSQYRKQPHTIRVTAFRNGSREPFVRLAAPNIKMLLEYCTDKLSLPFAGKTGLFGRWALRSLARKTFHLIVRCTFPRARTNKDPYATTKRNIIPDKWSQVDIVRGNLA
ncbi:hypothetical protein DPMN_008041 [Dreissena polymorpha]|uniref:Uncharacterized protein n=1 Tax=Dreissena polymorpha TaxID=45954 RepID=A0A9D4RWY5_DREPO|nr:hypothetical protein DPMN_008041 [Dreissena polymorpha]